MTSLEKVHKLLTNNNNIIIQPLDDVPITDNTYKSRDNRLVKKQFNIERSEPIIHQECIPSGHKLLNDSINIDLDPDSYRIESKLQTTSEYAEHDTEFREQFAAHIKRELSLPNKIRIPDHYINKRLSLCNIRESRKAHQCEDRNNDLSTLHLHRHTHVLESNINSPQVTADESHQDNSHKPEKNNPSRVSRRQSLFEIGFGQLKTYEKLKVIGSGSYSNVYKGSSRLTNEFVALKEISLQRDEGVPFTAIREVSLLKQLKHANIVTLHDFIYTKKSLTLVFEFMDHDLTTYMLRCNYNINLENVRLFLFQLLRGLKYCHDRRILHRDLKPQNLLLNDRGELKLADFGLARAKSVPIKTFTDEVVTLWYRPPDVLMGNTDYGPSIDTWGVGCIFYEMATGKTLFTGTNQDHQLQKILETIGLPNVEEWPTFRNHLRKRKIYPDTSNLCNFGDIEPRIGSTGIDLLTKFIRCEPLMRISANDAMKHDYFRNLPMAIHKLSSRQSIFLIDTIKLAPEKVFWGFDD